MISRDSAPFPLAALPDHREGALLMQLATASRTAAHRSKHMKKIWLKWSSNYEHLLLYVLRSSVLIVRNHGRVASAALGLSARSPVLPSSAGVHL